MSVRRQQRCKKLGKANKDKPTYDLYKCRNKTNIVCKYANTPSTMYCNQLLKESNLGFKNS